MGSGHKRKIRSYFRRYQSAFAGGMLFLVLTQACALSVPQFLRIGTDALIAKDADLAKLSALGLIAAAIAGAVVRIFSRILIFNSGRRVECDLRDDLYAHLIGLSESFFHKMPTGQIMSRAVNDLTQVRLLLGPGVLNLTNAGLVYLVVIPLLLWSDLELAILSLVSLPLLLICGRWMGKKIYELSRLTQDRLGTLSDRVQENLGGVTTIRVYRREEHETQRFIATNDDYYEANVNLARLRGILFPVMGLFGSVGSVVLLYLGGHRVIEGRMTVGQFVEFNAYLGILIWPTIALGWMIALWQRGMAAMERLNEIFETTPAIFGNDTSVSEVANTEYLLQAKNLSFTYPDQTYESLNEISLDVKAGEFVVVVGKTGSGKTTLLKLLARQLPVADGSLFLEGKDYNQLAVPRIRERFAYAPQEAFLFSRSLKDNIQFAVSDASDVQIDQVITQAGLKQDLSAFNEELETLVGERGVTLSGGQRQRTTLARALIKEADILILDDTLSAVDNETESTILESIATRQKQTTILVTHRLAAAGLADRILVLEEGRIIEQGTESELLELGGEYARLHQRQRQREKYSDNLNSEALT